MIGDTPKDWSTSSSSDPTPINLDKDVKEAYVLEEKVKKINVAVDKEKKTDGPSATDSGEISISCVVPPVALIEEEERTKGHVQASVYRYVASVF